MILLRSVVSELMVIISKKQSEPDTRRIFHIMDKETYSKIESYMLSCMNDGAHDKQHIYRVLYFALDIAGYYQVDMDVLIASSLLHDIGRAAQFKNPEIDHAIVGSEMAYDFIIGLGWTKKKADEIKNCISTHRYRKNHEPESLEAQILFDADKLDVTGSVGIARTLAYIGIVSEPLYSVDKSGNILDGTKDSAPSFFQEYNYKLKQLYGRFYTERAKKIAAGRKIIAEQFYEAMLEEVKETYKIGKAKLKDIVS